MSHEIEIVSKSLEQSSMAGAIAPPIPLPSPRVPIEIRVATMSDLPFIDSLQKKQTKNVGWFPTKAIEGKINAGHALIADLRLPICELNSPIANCKSQIANPVGYLIGADQYFKRDDVGIIYQVNVAPGKQRGFIGAALLKVQFERSAYGCRLYCCWCAQDIEANRFWEAMGFVPLAFRAGSREKGRVHIFWQKRICEGDAATSWWYPCQTNSGSIREDRIVLPIPPGTHWSEVTAVVEEDRVSGSGCRVSAEEKKRLPALNPKPEPRNPRPDAHPPRLQKPTCARVRFGRPSGKASPGGWGFTPPVAARPQEVALAKVEAPKRKKNPTRKKNDAKLVSAARELRDRWLERVNEMPTSYRGKYELSTNAKRGKNVSRRFDASAREGPVWLLPNAAA